jgi:hypothetical protein
LEWFLRKQAMQFLLFLLIFFLLISLGTVSYLKMVIAGKSFRIEVRRDQKKSFCYLRKKQ